MTQTHALLWTLAIEVPVVVVAVRLLRWEAVPLWQLAVVAVGASLLTHPLLWMLMGDGAGIGAVLVAEGVVALVEGAAFALAGRLGWVRGLTLGLVANAASFGVGLLII